MSGIAFSLNLPPYDFKRVDQITWVQLNKITPESFTNIKSNRRFLRDNLLNQFYIIISFASGRIKGVLINND